MGFCGTKSDAMSVEDGVIQNECYVDVLNIIPHAVLQLVSIFILTVWNHSVIGKLKVKTWVHYQGHDLRWICTLALLIVTALEIVEGILSDVNDSDDSTNYHAFVPPCMAFVGTFLSIVFYHNVEMWNSPRFLLVLLFYWPLAVILKCLKAISMYRNEFVLRHLKVWLVILDIVLYILLLVIELNVLRCQRYSFFKKSRRKRPPADLENTRFLQPYVNFMSKAVYWWVNDLLIKGFRRPLNTKDLGKLPQTERSSKVYKQVQMIFEEEKFKANQNKSIPSLMKVLMKASWKMMFAAGFLKFFGDLLTFVGPLLIEEIVNYAYDTYDPIDTKNKSSTSLKNMINQTHTYVEVDTFFSNGYILTVVLLICTLLHHIFLQNHFYLVIREGVRMRTAIQTMVYSKALRLSTLVLTNGSTTQGQIINHMSIDSTFIMYLYFFVHYLWAVPLQVLITLLLMYYKMGIAALIGGLCVILAAPVMYILGVLMSKLQKKILIESDKRVKKINEMIQGIKAIKLLAWERGFFNSVIATRRKELYHLWPCVICRAFVGFLGIASPVVGTLMTFLLYPVFEDQPLAAGAAMSVLALLNLLQGPLQIMTLLSATIANARVSSKRLMPFLLAEEVGRSHDSLPSFSKSCSIGFDSTGASGHATADKLDSMVSLDGKLPAIELQSLENKSCLSVSNASVKMPLTPTHSRHNSGSGDIFRGGASTVGGAHSLGHVSNLLSENASSSNELLDVKCYSNNLHRKASAPALGGHLHTSGESRRKRHSSNRSMDEDDTVIADDQNLSEMHSYIDVQAGFFSWDLPGEETVLKDISIKIPTSKLTMIVGQVGSGKSSLLSAMLGEMTQVSGNLHKSRLGGSTAYVSQKSWILNATLKDNILFGKPYVLRKYKRVVAACSLQIDIDLLPAGDNTEIGEKGVNLSGGQKQRVALARALYSDAEFVILDDPLSSLDSHVSKHVMEEAILKRLVRRNKTVVMVTHHLQYLSHAHQVIVMSNGHVHFHGKVSEVKKFDPDLYEIWRKAIREAKAAELSQKLESGDCLGLERKHSGGSQSQLSVPGLQNMIQSGRKLSAMSVMTEASNEGGGEEGDQLDDEEQALKPNSDSLDERDKGKLIKAEHREVGAVSVWVYLYYLKACSLVMCLLTFLGQFAYHTLMVATNFWLSTWASESSKFVRNVSRHADDMKTTTNRTVGIDGVPEFDNSPYLPTFIYLSISAVVAVLLGCLIAYHTGYVGSKNMFLQLLGSVMHLPMRFFDTNPSGRVINRFSSDITNIDQRIAINLEQFLRCMFFTLSAVTVNCIITPYFCFGALPFFVLYYGIQRFFRATSRELQRLDSVTKSFVFSHLSETIEGLETIRAFGVQSEFKRKAFKSIDSNVTPFLFIQTANRWLGIRLDFMSSLLVFIAAIVSLSAASSLSSPALVGLCIAYALMVTGQLNWIVRTSAEVEMSMNAVERIMEYTDEPMEPSIIGTGPAHSVPDSWPSKGHIEFQSVTLSYDIDLEPVLHNASFIIQGGEKIGVCGRTGSGKTSTTLALFRLLDMMDGTILIDDVDISVVDLAKLRSRLAIIPQEPILFNESIRFNLDPNGKHSDEKIWTALEQVQIKDTVSELPGQLDAMVVEKGDNLSMGQRQLLCLARAFLRDSKIVVMDEATASIDPVTDVKIQDIIHSPLLHDRTVITIAHRISTIIKYDKVLVLEAGEVREFDTPAQLLSDETSIFYGLVHSASDHDLK